MFGKPTFAASWKIAKNYFPFFTSENCCSREARRLFHKDGAAAGERAAPKIILTKIFVLLPGNL